MAHREIYDFGPFRLDCAERILTKAGARISLPPKAFDTLLALLRRGGQLREKEDLLKTIWPDTFVEEGNLALNISILRKTLDEGGPYIETVPKRGYRFVGEVRTAEPAASAPSARGARRRLVLIAASAAVVATAGATWKLWPVPQERSVAVMPFLNLTGDPANEYFADGFTEEVIDRLANRKDLRVIARTSVFTFKNKPADVREIGRRLGVGLVLEGSVRQSGREWRITAQLIETRGGAHLWSRTYDRSIQDVFTVQDDLGREIAASFSVPAPPPGDVRTDPAARDLTMQARFQLSLRNRQGIERAQDLLRKALDVDPRYGRAWAILSEYHYAAAEFGLEPPGEAITRSREAAEKSVALDDGVALAHIRLGVLRLDYEWNWAAAEREFRRAMEVEPGAPAGFARHGMLQIQRGRAAQGLTEIRRAMRLDPLGASINSDYAMALHLARRYDEAIAQAGRAMELAPASIVPYYRRGWALAAKGDCRAALADADAMQQRGASPLLYLALRGYCDRAHAREYLGQLEAMRKPRDRSPWSFALIWCGLGDRDRFFEEFDHALDLPDSYMTFTGVDPILDPMRSDPRFAVRLRRLGL